MVHNPAYVQLAQLGGLHSRVMQADRFRCTAAAFRSRRHTKARRRLCRINIGISRVKQSSALECLVLVVVIVSIIAALECKRAKSTPTDASRYRGRRTRRDRLPSGCTHVHTDRIFPGATPRAPRAARFKSYRRDHHITLCGSPVGSPFALPYSRAAMPGYRPWRIASSSRTPPRCPRVGLRFASQPPEFP